MCIEGRQMLGCRSIYLQKMCVNQCYSMQSDFIRLMLWFNFATWFPWLLNVLAKYVKYFTKRDDLRKHRYQNTDKYFWYEDFFVFCIAEFFYKWIWMRPYPWSLSFFKTESFTIYQLIMFIFAIVCNISLF